MIHILAWFAVYILILYWLGRVLAPWRERSWFKIAFLPGAMLAAVLQTASGLLCLGATCKISPVADRRPTFGLEGGKVPCLAGALFVLLSHFLFYVVFLIFVSQLEGRGLLNAHVVSLPNLYPYQVMEGHIEVNLRGYLSGLNYLIAGAFARPLPFLLVLYLAAGAFSCLRVSGRECRWGAIVLLVLGGILYSAEWFGVGFPFMSRGWWAGLFRFPGWWVLFSYYITMAGLTLFLFSAPRLSSIVWGALRPKEEKKGSSSKEKRAKVAVTA
jgi:hypothetical protein